MKSREILLQQGLEMRARGAVRKALRFHDSPTGAEFNIEELTYKLCEALYKWWLILPNTAPPPFQALPKIARRMVGKLKTSLAVRLRTDADVGKIAVSDEQKELFDETDEREFQWRLLEKMVVLARPPIIISSMDDYILRLVLAMMGERKIKYMTEKDADVLECLIEKPRPGVEEVCRRVRLSQATYYRALERIRKELVIHQQEMHLVRCLYPLLRLLAKRSEFDLVFTKQEILNSKVSWIKCACTAAALVRGFFAFAGIKPVLNSDEFMASMRAFIALGMRGPNEDLLYTD